MQINTINYVNEVSAKGSGKQSVKASEKIGFFGVVMEKAGRKQAVQNDYMNYDKTGRENEQSQGKNSGFETKQDFKEYINENIEKLKALVTDEDYSALSELGLAPDKEDPHTLLTVYERIQIELAAWCDGYDISELNINSQKIKAVLGSEAMASAVKMAGETGELTDAAKSYLMKNDLEPTIENAYKAVHSTSGIDSAASSLSDTEWKELKEQISGILEKSGMEVNEENLQNAKWLVEHDIQVTAENLLKLAELNQTDMQNKDVIVSNTAFALMMGMNGTEAYVTRNWIQTDEIAQTMDAIANVSDEIIYDIVNDDAVLNAANIKKYQAVEQQKDKDNDAGQKQKESQRDFENPSFIRARTVIIEARLVMTSSSLLNMQKLGISITYTEISVMLTQTKQDNNDYYASFFEGQDSASVDMTDTLNSMMDIMKSMSQVPSAVMGEIYKGNMEFTLESVYEESKSLSASYTKAELAYEAVGTQVRTDLGDNISKAFESIDNILKDIGIDINESSRRAARILGYNQMEITKQAVFKMESLMEELDYVRDNLTPKTAAYLVENHVNILNTDIRELNQHLVELNAMIGADESEDFAKYLWKLEKAGEISEENRNRYVDLYRTLNMVESMDSSSIGAVTLEGAEFTLNNLLSAVKSKRKTVDVKVDDSVGLQEINADAKDTSSEDIAQFVRRMAEKVKSGLNAENVEKIYKEGRFGEISLGNLVDLVSDNESVRTNARLNAEYVKQVMDNYFKEAAEEGITEDTVLTLMEGGQNASMENIVSAMQLSMPGSDFRKYLLDSQNRKEAAERILEDFEDKESAKEAVQELKKTASIKDMAGPARNLSYEQVKSMADINRNLRFMVKSTENESYHIPVDIDGEAVNIRVSFVRDEGEGKVNISMNTMAFGKIDCVIHSVNMVSGVKSEAIVYCENVQTAGIITGSRSIFVNEIKGLDFVSEFSMEVVRSKISMNNEVRKRGIHGNLAIENVDEDKVESRYLYKISKGFIKSVKDCLQSIR